MDFRLSAEEKMIQRTVRDFVKNELIPLEQDVLKNEREGRPGLHPQKVQELQDKAKRMGFWHQYTGRIRRREPRFAGDRNHVGRTRSYLCSF